MKPKKKTKVYERQYDTTEEAKLSPFQRAVRDRITLRPVMKKVKMQDPDFATTDAQRFLHTYERKKFRQKVAKAFPGEYRTNDIQFLPLTITDNPYFKNNAFYDGSSFQYNGIPNSKIREYFPTFADVMAHEVGHQMDGNYFIKHNNTYKSPSEVYSPFVNNNKGLYDLNRFGYEERVNAIKKGEARAYEVYHDYFPSEIFADIMADKYMMNVANIYNSLGDAPFTIKDYKNYQNYLKRTRGTPWSRGMRMLIRPGQNYDLPDADIYTKAMNDL